MNLKDFYIKKHKILKAVRDYFELTGAIEVITDILREYPNLDSNIYPIEVEYFKSDGKKRSGYLHTSPEYEMKIILSQIKRDIFQIAKVFRNFEGSKIHKTEFLMLEWYRVNYNLDDLMEDTKNIFIQSALSIYKKAKINFNGKEYNLFDWEKLTVEEAFYRYAKVDIYNKNSMYQFLKKSSLKHSNIDPDNWEELFFTIYSFYIEKNLGKDRPTFIYNYPEELGALSEIEGKISKRFEAYIGGIELVNGYQELRNPEILKRILERDIQRKYKESKKLYKLDTKFINSVKNLPKCSGASLGLDRLIMVLLNQKKIL